MSRREIGNDLVNSAEERRVSWKQKVAECRINGEKNQWTDGWWCVRDSEKLKYTICTIFVSEVI